MILGRRPIDVAGKLRRYEGRRAVIPAIPARRPTDVADELRRYDGGLRSARMGVMRAKWSEIPGLMMSAPGRKRLRDGAVFKLFLALRPLAAFHRRVFLRSTRLITVVGSFGKTTAASAVAAALGLDASRRGAGWNAGGFLALELLRTRPRTPRVVLEVGISTKGIMARYARLLRPDVVIVTSIGSEHHESLGSLEETRQEKAAMVRALSRSGYAVLNGDDPNVRWMAGQTQARGLTFGFDAWNDVRASDLEFDGHRGMRFRLHMDGSTYAATTRLLGRHMAYPILAAVAVARQEGIPVDEALARLSRLAPIHQRMEAIEAKGGVVLLIDSYKGASETVDLGLATLAEVPASRKLAVLGEIEKPVGAQGPSYKALGRRLAGVVSCVVFVGGETAFRSVASGARESGMERSALVHAGRSTRRAAELVAAELRPGDVVWIKGRSTQRLERVALALRGWSVPCDVVQCVAQPGCRFCPLMRRANKARKGS